MGETKEAGRQRDHGVEPISLVRTLYLKRDENDITCLTFEDKTCHWVE